MIDNTCELLQNRLSPVDFCVMLFSEDYVSAHAPFPEAEAIQDALTQFYLSRLERGETVNLTRVIELLDRMVELKAEREHKRAVFMISTFAQLGMTSEAVDVFYRYALAAKRDDVTYAAEQSAKAVPALARDPAFQWVLKRFGG